MLKNKQPMPVNIRASMQQQQQLASARNRRLAQQMENRPSVQAALKLKQSLKQRLGKSNIQARLGRPIGALARGAIGGRSLPIIQRGLPRGGLRGGRATRTLLRGGMSLRGQCVCVAGNGWTLPSSPFSWAAYQHMCLAFFFFKIYLFLVKCSRGAHL